MGKSKIAGPDVICIGQPKAGTGWLFDQLKYHPDFWMPPVKEFAYLLRLVPEMQSARNEFQHIQHKRKRRKLAEWSNRRKGDTRDFQFLQEVNGAIGEPLDIERYVSFFRYKEGALSGDFSIGYCALPPSRIALIADRLPDTKILLLVRDPVDRAWSHICMWRRAGKFDETLLERPVALKRMLEETGNFRRTSFPTKIVAAWREFAPQMPFRYFLFDDIKECPAEARSEILQYLGGDPEKKSGGLTEGHNKKANAGKLELVGATKAMLVDMFQEELHLCADLFGGRAREWPGRYLDRTV